MKTTIARAAVVAVAACLAAGQLAAQPPVKDGRKPGGGAKPTPDILYLSDDNTTQALYRAEAVARGCERVLDAGGGRILDAFEGLETLTVEERELDGVVPTETFFDVDTPEDFERAQELLDRGFDKG